LYLGLAAISREAEQFSVLAEAEHTHRIANFQRSFKALHFWLNLLFGLDWLRNSRNLLFKLTGLLTSFVESISRQIGPVHFNLDLRERGLYGFELGPRLRPGFVENADTVGFELVALILQLPALIFSFGAFEAQMIAFICRCLLLGLQTFQQVLHAHTLATQELTPASDDALVQSQAMSNRQRVTA